MEQRTIYPYFFMGTAFRYLQDAQEEWPTDDYGVIFNIDMLLQNFDELKLRVTDGMEPVRELRNLRESLSEADDAILSADQALELRTIMDQVRATVDSELKTFSAFIVSDKRWAVEKLLEDTGELFRPGVFSSLPDIAKRDFEEAGRCIAFECPTAAAFHLLRGTESVLRMLYLSFVKRERLAPERRMWGPIVSHLRERRRQPPVTLLDNLDNIRRNYRNPTQHPDAHYDIHEAQDLLGLCLDVVNQMRQIIGS
jgi:hypothetical protein